MCAAHVLHKRFKRFKPIAGTSHYARRRRHLAGAAQHEPAVRDDTNCPDMFRYMYAHELHDIRLISHIHCATTVASPAAYDVR